MEIFLPSANAQFQFGLPIVSDCEADTREIVFTNLNEDAYLDLAVLNFSTGNVTPLFGDGFGKFDCGNPIYVGEFPTDIATGDFDNDEFADLVVLTQDPSDELVLLFGKGDGIFDEIINSDIGSPNDVVVNDFNLDLHADLAIAEGSSTVKTFLGQGDGMFNQGGMSVVGDAPIVLFSADLNRDDIPDLVTGHGLSNDFSIIFGDGNGFFSDPEFYPTEGNPWDFEVADVTSDGNLDLIVAINDEVSEIKVYEGDGFGIFSLYSTIELDFQPLGISVEDLNNDNIKDLAVSIDKINDNNILIFQGNGMGLFNESLQLSALGIPGQLFTEDLNLDGLPDLIVNDYRVSVFLNNQIVNSTKVLPAAGYFKLAPNPAGGKVFNIVLDNSSSTSNIVVTNNLGKEIYREEYASSNQSIAIPLSDFENGVYWVKVENETFIACEKLIVQR